MGMFDEVLLEATEESHAAIHHNRALCYNAMGRPDGAIAALRSCLALDDARPTSWHNLGVLLLNSGDQEGATDAINKACETASAAEEHEQLMQSRTTRAALHKQAGEIDQAIDQFDAAIDAGASAGLTPPQTAYCQLAECLCRQRDWETASVVYGSCISEHGGLASDGDASNYGLALFNLARKEQQDGDIAAAEGSYLKSLEQARKPHTMHNLAVLYMTSERAAEAEPLLREVVQEDTGHMLALAALGTSLAQSDRFSEAIPFLERGAAAAAEASDTATEGELRRVLGVSCFKEKRFAEAKVAFERAFELDPENASAATGAKLAQENIDRGDGVARPPRPPSPKGRRPGPLAGRGAVASSKPAAFRAGGSAAATASSSGPARSVKPSAGGAAGARSPKPIAAAAGGATIGGGDVEVDTSADGHVGVCLPLDALTTGPFADGVDTKCREAHLSLSEFESVMGMSKAAFYAKPKWKRTQLKKKHGLF